MFGSSLTRLAVITVCASLAVACSSADDDHDIGSTEQAMLPDGPPEPRETAPPISCSAYGEPVQAPDGRWYCYYSVHGVVGYSASVTICWAPTQYRRCGSYSCYCSAYP